MLYTSKITEQKRSLIIMMIDQSGSMNQPFASTLQHIDEMSTKAQIVAETCNIMLMDIIARCRSGSIYKHYFDICVLGYSNGEVRSLLPRNYLLMSPTDLASNIRETKYILRRVQHPNGEYISYHRTLKVWVESHADGDSPMYLAMQKVSEVLYSWRNAQKHKDAFPPTIINITDGEATDIIPDKLKKLRNRISQLGTTDGEPLFFNLHISNLNRDTISFPRTDEKLTEEAKLLFNISSPLPHIFDSAIRAFNSDTSQSSVPYRAFSYNLPISDFINAISIGTATTQQIYV